MSVHQPPPAPIVGGSHAAGIVPKAKKSGGFFSAFSRSSSSSSPSAAASPAAASPSSSPASRRSPLPSSTPSPSHAPLPPPALTPPAGHPAPLSLSSPVSAAPASPLPHSQQPLQPHPVQQLLQRPQAEQQSPPSSASSPPLPHSHSAPSPPSHSPVASSPLSSPSQQSPHKPLPVAAVYPHAFAHFQQQQLSFQQYQQQAASHRHRHPHGQIVQDPPYSHFTHFNAQQYVLQHPPPSPPSVPAAHPQLHPTQPPAALPPPAVSQPQQLQSQAMFVFPPSVHPHPQSSPVPAVAIAGHQPGPPPPVPSDSPQLSAASPPPVRTAAPLAAAAAAATPPVVDALSPAAAAAVLAATPAAASPHPAQAAAPAASPATPVAAAAASPSPAAAGGAAPAAAPAPRALSPLLPAPAAQAAAPPFSLAAFPAPLETGGPAPPPPSVAANPSSFFAQLLASAPRTAAAASPQTVDESTARRVREGLDAVKRSWEERDRRERRRREEREEKLRRTERAEGDLLEKKRAATMRKEKEEEKDAGGAAAPKGGEGLKRMLVSWGDGKVERELERIRLKKTDIVSEREFERKRDKEREMERDAKTLIIASAAAIDDFALTLDLSQIPALLSGLAAHAQDATTVQRVVHHLYCMYLAQALAPPAPSPSPSSPSYYSSPDSLFPLHMALYESGAISRLVHALFDHADVVAIQRDCLLLLSLLSHCVLYAGYAIQNGVISATTIAMSSHTSSLPVQQAGCALLFLLAHHQPMYIPYMLQCEVLPLLLSSLQHHPTAELLHYQALTSLLALAVSAADVRVMMGEAAVVETVITSMYSFQQSATVQRVAVQLLSSLCDGEIENGRRMYRNSGIQATMLAVRGHEREDETLLLSALSVMMQMEWQQIVAQKALDAVDGFAILLTAARCHLHNLEVQRATAAVIAVACEHSPDLQQRAVQRGVPDWLLAVCKHYSTTHGTESLYCHVCQCLRHLSACDANKSTLSSPAVITLIFTAIKLHTVSDSVALHCAATLAHLTEHGDEPTRRQLVQQVGDAGLVVVLHVMECHSPVRAVIEQCVSVLYHLLRHSVEYQQRLIQCDGIPALLTACKDHSSSEPVCRHTIAIFSLLSDSLDEKELFLRLHGDSINNILIAMRNHPSSLQLQLCALLTLRNLTNKFDCGNAKSAEIVDTTLVKMKAFPSSALVQQYACECLWNLALTDPANKRKLQAGEAIALVLAARREHRLLFDVMHAANGLLDVLECSVAEEGREVQSWEQMQEEAMRKEAEAHLTAMAAAPNDARLQLAATDRLCALSAMSPAVFPTILTALPTLFSSLRNHPYLELVQVAGLNTLTRIAASSPSAAAAVTAGGGIAAAMTALDPLPASPLLIENALSLLSLLCMDATSAAIVARVGALPLVLAALDRCVQVLGVQEQAMRLLRLLVQGTQEGAATVLQEGGIAVLVRSLAAWAPRSVVVAEESLLVSSDLLRCGGGALTAGAAELYWQLVAVARMYPWHQGIQRGCAVVLPALQQAAASGDAAPLPGQPPPPYPDTAAAAAAQPAAGGPPGGAASVDDEAEDEDEDDDDDEEEPQQQQADSEDEDDVKEGEERPALAVAVPRTADEEQKAEEKEEKVREQHRSRVELLVPDGAEAEVEEEQQQEEREAKDDRADGSKDDAAEAQERKDDAGLVSAAVQPRAEEQKTDAADAALKQPTSSGVEQQQQQDDEITVE